MGLDTASAHLAHAADLERRDAAIAGELEAIRTVAERAGAIRSRAAEIGEALARIPAELEELATHRGETERETALARSDVVAADARLAELESGRRRKADDLDRARREAATARERLADAETRLGRLTARDGELRDELRALHDEEGGLARAAAAVAADIRGIARVTESAQEDPGGSLDELEEWGARVRSALFVARGTLETERERIVVEANALGTAVLGESLGASSVAVVRRRLEERLA